MLVCVGVSLFEGWVSCLTWDLRSDSQLLGYRGKLWQLYSCWADFPDETNGKMLKLSKGRAEGQPWICCFDLGLRGAGRRNKCGIAFGPSLTMLCTGGSCGQMISCWNWPPNAFQIFQGNQVGGFNKEHDRLAACTVFDVWWVVFNYVQCVFGFYGQFENICRKHM